jgi:tRNA A37 methylthiotransferase MiaB
MSKSHSSKMLLPMMKSRQQINFSQQVFGNAAILFVEYTIQQGCSQKCTFGSVDKTAGTEVGGKWCSEGVTMVKITAM